MYEPAEPEVRASFNASGSPLWRLDDRLGFSLDEASSLTYAPVWQAVQLLSGDLAKIPLEKRRRTGPKSSEAVPTDPMYRRVHDYPNADQGAFKFWRRAWVQALLWTRAFIEIRSHGLYLLESTFVQRRRLREGDMAGQFVYYYMEQGGNWRVLFPSQVLEIEGLTLHRDDRDYPVQPPTTVDNARKTIELGLAAERFGKAFFDNGGRLGGVLELPLGMPKKARDTIEEGFQDAYANAESAFKTVVLRDGAKYHTSQATPDKSQMTAAHDQQVADVARWYGLPPHKLGLQVNTSYRSLEQENKAYQQQALMPWLCAAADEANNKLLTDSEKRLGRVFFRHDLSGLLATELPELMEMATKGVSTGILSPNEAREYLGMNPVDGGDELLRPLNQAPAGESGALPESSSPDSPNGDSRINGNGQDAELLN